MKTCHTSSASEKPQKSAPARANAALACLLTAVAVFYAATVRTGHVWGDDFAMYIHHAQNIAEGRAYADTGYIYNPAAPVGPRIYPPVFPLLLAPLYKFFGLNLLPMKLEQIVFFLLTLAAVFAFWQRDLGSASAIALVAILGFSPVFWAAKDNVLSDLPFLLFFYVAAVLVRWASRDQPSCWLWAVLIGLFLYLAMGTRTAGIALIAGLVLYDALQFRTLTRLTVVALSVWAGLMLLQYRYIGTGIDGYADEFRPTLHTSAANLMVYLRVLAGFWVASTRNPLSFFVLGIVVFLTVAGIYFRYKRGPTIVEAFLAPYLVIVLLWPYAAGIRLAFPFVPWIVSLALAGLRELTENFSLRRSTVAGFGLLLLVVVGYGRAYRTIDFGPIRQDSGLPEFNQLCQAVRDRTLPGDVLIYYRARSLSLYTRRSVSSYNGHSTEEEFQQYMRNIHATYLVTTSAFDSDGGFLVNHVEKDLRSFDLAYENASFKLYRILPVGTEAAPPPAQITEAFPASHVIVK